LQLRLFSQLYVRDNEWLLKLIWDPDDINEDGSVKPSAFRKDELVNRSKGVSVERYALCSMRVLNAIIAKQKRKAGAPGVVRENAFISRLHCLQVREIAIDGKRQLIVDATPTARTEDVPANPAHAEIFNDSGIQKRSYILKVRLEIAGLCSDPAEVGEVFR
jgi:hypothetical protein